jgi:hypothetical protein
MPLTILQSNSSNILLFHKCCQAKTAKSGKAGASRMKCSLAGLEGPIKPEDLEINIEDLIIKNLANNNKKIGSKSMGKGMYCVLPWRMY